MKTKNSVSIVALRHSIVLIATFVLSSSAHAQKTYGDRAFEGDTVCVVINHVKADKRQQFEHFVHDLIADQMNKLGPEEQAMSQHVRVLHPVHQEKDSTYTYIFIMDPVIPGADYRTASVLGKLYDPQKIAEYSKMFGDSKAAPSTLYICVQSRH